MYLKILFLLLIVSNSAVYYSHAQQLPSATPASQNVSDERLMSIDRMLQQGVDSNWINNAVGCIVRNGKVVYNKSFGKTVTGQAIPTNAIYRIASQTKAITSVAAMMLYEEGKFLLDDPISAYIPAFKGQQVIATYNKTDGTYTTVPANREVTIRDLFMHTSGIEYPEIGQYALMYAKAGIPAGWTSAPVKLKDKIEALAKFPLVHQPGAQFTYGYNVDVLGYLIEVLSGMDLNDFLKERLFKPLGMDDTYFYLPESKYNRLIPHYTEDGSHHPLKWNKNMPGLFMDFAKTKGTYYAGGAGLVSTVQDYAIFLQMLLNGGKYNDKSILSTRTVEMMITDQIGDIPSGYLGVNRWGLGFMLITKKGQNQLGMSEGSFVWGGAFNTIYWADPRKQVIGLLFINQSPLTHKEIPDKFKALVYQALKD